MNRSGKQIDNPDLKDNVPKQKPSAKANKTSMAMPNARINNNNASTTARQWLVLSQIEQGRWVGTIELQQALKLAGFDVSLRTVQRDLVALSKRFLLEKNNANPQGWRWQEDAPLQSLPNMNLSQAVAFSMVQENLAQLLPPAILKELHPWFDLANRQLKENNAMQSWLDKVRIEPASLSLIPPDIDVQIKNDIYQAVFEQRQIQASYTKVNATEPTDYLLNPLALVQRGAIIYLLATKLSSRIEPSSVDRQSEQQPMDNLQVNLTKDNQAVHSASTADTQIQMSELVIRKFTLHRFTHVAIQESPAIIPDDFSLDAYIDSGEMGFNEDRFADLPNKGKHTQVTLTFANSVGNALIESKLADNQVVNINEDASISVTATVNLTRQLVWWLRGFGSSLLAAEPERLWQVVRDMDI